MDFTSLASLVQQQLAAVGAGLEIIVLHDDVEYPVTGVRQAINASQVNGTLIQAQDFYLTVAATDYTGDSIQMGDKVKIGDGPWMQISHVQVIQPALVPLAYKLLVRG